MPRKKNGGYYGEFKIRDPYGFTIAHGRSKKPYRTRKEAVEGSKRIGKLELKDEQTPVGSQLEATSRKSKQRSWFDF